MSHGIVREVAKPVALRNLHIITNRVLIMRRMHYLRLEIVRCHNIRALLQDYYCTFKFKVAMAMDQSIERFKTLRVHCSVTFHPQQIETIFCLHMLQSLWRLVPSRIVHARIFFFFLSSHYMGI